MVRHWPGLMTIPRNLHLASAPNKSSLGKSVCHVHHRVRPLGITYQHPRTCNLRSSPWLVVELRDLHTMATRMPVGSGLDGRGATKPGGGTGAGEDEQPRLVTQEDFEHARPVHAPKKPPLPEKLGVCVPKWCSGQGSRAKRVNPQAGSGISTRLAGHSLFLGKAEKGMEPRQARFSSLT